jgi:hypothetical protein
MTPRPDMPEAIALNIAGGTVMWAITVPLHITLALTTMAFAAAFATPSSAQEEGTGGRCIPLAERGDRAYGCFIIAREPIGALPSGDIYWHVERFVDLASASAAAGPRSKAL